MGPIPVPLARALAVDSFLALVFTEAGDIRAVHHLGRTINATLRTALAFRDRGCVVPGCAMPYGLEIDHVHPVALGGPDHPRQPGPAVPPPPPAEDLRRLGTRAPRAERRGPAGGPSPRYPPSARSPTSGWTGPVRRGRCPRDAPDRGDRSPSRRGRIDRPHIPIHRIRSTRRPGPTRPRTACSTGVPDDPRGGRTSPAGMILAVRRLAIPGRWDGRHSSHRSVTGPR